MSISRINFTSNSNLLYNIKQNTTPHSAANTSYTPSTSSKVQHSRKPITPMLIFGSVITLIGLGILGRLGKLGKSVQKFLGGLKEQTQNIIKTEERQSLLPMHSQQASNVEFVEVEVLDTNFLFPRRHFSKNEYIEDVPFVEL